VAGIIFAPVIVLGLILGLYELILIHKDMNFRGSHWVGHGLHSVIFMMVALFIVLNTEFFFGIVGLASWGLPAWVASPWIFRILVGIILNIKMHGTSSLSHGGKLAARGMAEHWIHTSIITLLVVLSPLYWGVISSFLPGWLLF